MLVSFLFLADLGERVECEFEHWRNPPFAKGGEYSYPKKRYAS